jgi:hypothetical protein
MKGEGEEGDLVLTINEWEVLQEIIHQGSVSSQGSDVERIIGALEKRKVGK